MDDRKLIAKHFEIPEEEVKCENCESFEGGFCNCWKEKTSDLYHTDTKKPVINCWFFIPKEATE